MFQTFFSELRAAKIPVTIREYLTLLEGLDKNVPEESLDGFYYLARTALVKDERNLDKFDQVFSPMCFAAWIISMTYSASMSMSCPPTG